MMKLQTPVVLPPAPKPLLGYGMNLISFGSCFSEHIGRRLADEGFHIEVNPFGVQYNPLSIAYALERLLSSSPYAPEELFVHDGLYHSFDHHGSFSAPSQEDALRGINVALERAALALQRADYLLITWGTAYVYELLSTGRVVSNCHKMPERMFRRRRCALPELLELWQGLLERLFDAYPNLRIIQTVSPIRHLRDGAQHNQLSKATLLLLCDALGEHFPGRVSYFPAYELVMDELRDYRFYAEDMLHPTEQTIRYIGDSFVSWLASPESKEVMPHIARLRREYRHRPLRDIDPEGELRREQLLLRIRAFAAQYPDVCLTSWLAPEDL